MSSKVVIDASNLRVGGGVQVATAFLSDLLAEKRWETFANQFQWLEETDVAVSAEVRRNLEGVLTEQELFRIGNNGRTRESSSNVRFTVFGPKYGPARSKRHIMGFADVTSIYKWPVRLPPRSLRQRVRRPLAMLSFRRADTLVVETSAVRDRLMRLGVDGSSVKVVANSCHPMFLESRKWRPRQLDSDEAFRLLYVARAYPHKNHEFLGFLGHLLDMVHKVRVSFTVTLTQEEWKNSSGLFRKYAHNVGPKTVAELPQLYLSSDAVIFPSLLECFSATPMEAMALGVPLLASDRDFVRTICGEGATYFDPEDPESAAVTVRDLLADPDQQLRSIACGFRAVQASPTSMDRTRGYLELIDSEWRRAQG